MTVIAAGAKCCVPVGGGYRPPACGRRAKYERNGKHYCGTHDPVAMQAKRDARSHAWDAKWAADALRAQHINLLADARSAVIAAARAACIDGSEWRAHAPVREAVARLNELETQ